MDTFQTILERIESDYSLPSDPSYASRDAKKFSDEDKRQWWARGVAKTLVDWVDVAIQEKYDSIDAVAHAKQKRVWNGLLFNSRQRVWRYLNAEAPYFEPDDVTPMVRIHLEALAGLRPDEGGLRELRKAWNADPSFAASSGEFRAGLSFILEDEATTLRRLQPRPTPAQVPAPPPVVAAAQNASSKPLRRRSKSSQVAELRSKPANWILRR